MDKRLLLDLMTALHMDTDKYTGIDTSLLNNGITESEIMDDIQNLHTQIELQRIVHGDSFVISPEEYLEVADKVVKQIIDRLFS